MNAQKEQGISPFTLFYSYADEDEELCKELEKHLSLLQRQGMIAGWHHHKLMPGANRDKVSDEHFSLAQIILLLVSPDFLASSASHSEMQRALQRHESGLAHVILLLLRPADWEHAPFAHLQVLSRNGQPVTLWKNSDLAFVDIAKGLRSAINQWNASRSYLSHQLPQSTLSVPLSPFLFLSSAKKDLSLVNRLKDDLQAHGIVGWMDHKAVPDEEDLREAIRNASAVILIASAHTRRSRLVKQELQIAEMYQRAIYLLWMQGNDLIEVMPTGWSHLRFFDARAERYPQAFQDLLQAFGNQILLSPSSSGQKEHSTNASHSPSKYIIKSDGSMQGQVIGEHVYVTMNFGNGQEEDQPPLQMSSNKSDHAPSSQDHLLEQPVPPLEAPRNPYKGLYAFRAEDAQDFFGRDRLIKELLEKVQQLLTIDQQDQLASRLLTVLGPSGSGKSSVVMAGLLPKLKQGTLTGSEHWIYLDPIVPGKRPIEALTLTLTSLFPERSLKSIREDLEDDSARGLHLLLTRCVKRSDMSILLVIDQFEELFTQTATEDERQQFLDLLLAATSELHGPLIAVLTLRADFYDRPLQYPELGRLIKSHQVIVFPMEMPGLRKVIEQPSQLPDVQLLFEEDLIGDLLFDVHGQVGALPLLQFTLDQLFQHRKERLLTRQSYQKIGGVKGALAQHAASTYQSLPTEAHQRLARALFLRLINPGTMEEDATKRRIPLSELIAIDSVETVRLAEVTSAFTEARLLTTNTIGEISTVEVSHEALIRAWPDLADWLHEARDDIHLQQAISQDAAEWQRHGQPTDRLYRGSQLTEALKWREANLPSLDEDRFLQASIEELQRIQQQERQQRQRYTRRIVVIGLAGIAGMAGTGFLVNMLRGSASPLSPSRPKSLPFAYTGHTNGIYSVAWSPDGKRIASGSWDKTVQVWEASSGSLLLTYKGHTNAILSVAWSPDGKRIASGSFDKTVQVWEASNGSLLLTYKGHTNIVVSAAWSPDGKRIASGSWDKTVQIWEASSGSLLFTYKGHSRTVVSIAWSLDGKRIASGSADKTVQVWKASSGNLLLTYKGHTKTVERVAWSPDGKRIASGSDDKTVQVWEASSGSLLLTYAGHTDAVESVVWSPDGKRIASGSDDKTVQVWEASSGSSLFIYAGHTDAVESVAWSPDGSRLTSGSRDKTVQVWEASSGSPLLIYAGHTDAVESVVWSPDGKRIASGSDDKTVQVWEASSRSLLLTYKGHTDAVKSVAWSPDGKWIVSGSFDKTVQVWEASSDNLLLTYKGHTDAVESVAWSPDGKRIASGSADNTVQVWEASSGNLLLTYKGHINTIRSVAWSPDGKRIVSGSDDNTVQVWEASSGNLLLTYKGHINTIGSVAWSPDGKRIVSGSFDGIVQVWEPYSGNLLLTYTGHTKTIESVVWSPDGKRIASGSDDKTVQVWEASSGGLLLTYTGHTNTAVSVAWSPDGRRIASGSRDKTVQVWEA